MNIHSDKLQRIFKYLQPSTNSPLKMAEFNSFLFVATDNELMVRIYDGVIESIVKMEGKFEPVKFAVDEFIYKVVNTLNGEVSLELDGTNLIVDCGPKHYEFATVDCELWQPIVEHSPAEEYFAKENIKKFNKAHHCVATDESRPIYTGYHIRDGQLFSSDGFRAITIPINLADCSFQQKDIDSVLRCLDKTDNVYYKFGDYIFLKSVSDEFTGSYMMSKMDGEPFDSKNMFAEKEKNEPLATIQVSNLANKLKDVMVMYEQAAKLSETFYLTIMADNDEVYFLTNIKGLSSGKELVDAKLEGSDFVLNINPVYLMDFAKVADGAVTMKVIEPKSEPVLLYDESETKSLIMPMNIIK